MKVALISPSVGGTIADGGLASVERNNWLVNRLKKHLFGFGETSFIPPMALLSLAAVTPSNVSLTIIDERLQTIDYDMDVDLVGLSIITITACRAYEIAARFRQRGIPVVFGGIHATVLPEECLRHGDAVVIGEGEHVWPQLLSDARDGQLKPSYQSQKAVCIDSLPPPPFHLLSSPERYVTTKVVRASRGCPYGCTFCTTGTSIGRAYRKRPVNDIIGEIESRPGKYLFFLDDNLGVDRRWAMELFRALRPLNVKWYGAVSLNALADPAFIREAARAGCIYLGIGFESINEKTLKAMNKRKTNDPRSYRRIIRNIHRQGISIVGYFLMGYDTETAEDYRRLGDFLISTGIEIPSISALTPYPGSAICRHLEKEGRLLHRRWDHYYARWWDLAFQPLQMTQAAVYDNYLKLIDRLFSVRAILRRCWPHLLRLNLMTLIHVIQHGFYQKRILAEERSLRGGTTGGQHV
jgi:radical SAM superfamily enzyme YgiQ (UPF0313 family)